MRSMNDMVDVSIIMPNYNHSEYLEQTIRSVLSQSVRPREFIIVDDCSTDNSLEIMRRMQKEYPWIEVIANEKNMGPLNIVNEAGERATSKYLYFLPADDFVLPGFLEQFTKACEECSDFVLFKNCLEGWCIDTGDTFVSKAGWKDKRGYFSPEEVIRIIEGGGTCIASSPIYRKDAWLEAGKFIVDLGPFADWFCVYVMAARHGLFNCPDVLLVRRFTSDAYGTTMPRSEGLLRIMRLLNTSEYNDVVDFIIQCKAFAALFGRELIDYISSNDYVLHKKQSVVLNAVNMSLEALLLSSIIDDALKVEMFDKVLKVDDSLIAVAPLKGISDRVISLLKKKYRDDKIVIFDLDGGKRSDREYSVEVCGYDEIVNFDIGKVIITSRAYEEAISREFINRGVEPNKICRWFD